jgi:hypothetical protein
LPLPISRAGEWFLHSGIQELNGGVARYYRTDLERNEPVSTEITGYAVSALVYLHARTHDQRYLDAAIRSARFLADIAWDPVSRVMPFEVDPARYAYFFDCGIIVRGLLAAWRASGAEEFLETACAIGNAMIAEFAAADGWHPILELPAKTPAPRDPLRWSRSPGCYQLKSAMAWWDLADATGDSRFREPYLELLDKQLRTYGTFLPGHPERARVMDRLHAFAYFLEGLLPRTDDRRCATALCDGIRRLAGHLREIAPEFERSDVYAQLLRLRLYADWAGVTPLDRDAAASEAARLAGFQVSDPDPRVDGGFRFGHTPAGWLPFVNPVSTAFAMQALELWRETGEGGANLHRHLLI